MRSKKWLGLALTGAAFFGITALAACAKNTSDAPVVVDAGADVADEPLSIFGDAEPSEASIGAPIPRSCAEADDLRSYIGCDYWPTVTLNPVYEKFDFAVAVSNPQAGPASISITGGALTEPLSVTVNAGAVQPITLPWVLELKGPAFDQETVVADPGPSRIVPKGAYHLTSTVPVSVYQFSALEYEIDAGAPCPGYGDDGGAGPHCFSYSNDAALLLPTRVATGDYGVLSWPSFGVTPGFLVVTATVDNTHLTVYPAGPVQGVPDAGPSVMSRGDQYTYTLDAGDVLEMFSQTGDRVTPKYGSDLSGSIVHADQPVVTFGGHGCTFIPENKKACDHLESSMFPIQTLGNEYIVTMPHTPHGERQWVRILGLYPNTQMIFDPPVNGKASATLNAGEILELEDVDQPFYIGANGRILVAQYMYGEYGAVTDGGTPDPDLGDPSESPVVTISQYRSSYSFYAPDTYTESWMDVVALAGTTVTLDGVPFPPQLLQPTSKGFAIAHLHLPPSSGAAHEIHGTAAFGLVVYGFGSRTSYMYPGGLDLRPVAIGVPR